MNLEVSYAKWWPFCLSLNVLTHGDFTMNTDRSFHLWNNTKRTPSAIQKYTVATKHHCNASCLINCMSLWGHRIKSLRKLLKILGWMHSYAEIKRLQITHRKEWLLETTKEMLLNHFNVWNKLTPLIHIKQQCFALNMHQKVKKG